MSMAINVGRVGIYNEEFPSIKSPEPLIFQGHVNFLVAVSPLAQNLWPQILARW